MGIFLGTEAMFFAALISAYLVIRAGEPVWPPLGQPRLPVAATAANTLVLVASGALCWRAGRAFASRFRSGRSAGLLTWAWALGALFVLLQGSEWVRLVRFGLTLGSGVYVGLFYVIVGTHAAHVTGALGMLGYVAWRLSRPGERASDSSVFQAARMLWYFVVGIWPLLYVLVYLV
jgi:heme/copper-type cytochrome/quinol oxidase subunit 3